MNTLSLTSSTTSTFGDMQARVDGALKTFWNEMRANRARRRVYHRTFSELSALSTRGLDDIGISRYQIEEIAREAAYGA